MGSEFNPLERHSQWGKLRKRVFACLANTQMKDLGYATEARVTLAEITNMQRILVALALQGCAAYVAPPTPRRTTILRDSPFDGIGDLLEQVAAPPEDSSLPSGSFGAVVTGGAAGEVLAWRLEQASVVDGAGADAGAGAGTGAGAGAGAAGAGAAGGASGGVVAWEAAHVTLVGPLAAKSSARVARLRFGLGGSCVGVQYADRTLQLWSVQSDAQLKRQLKRRQTKRKRKEGDLPFQAAGRRPITRPEDGPSASRHRLVDADSPSVVPSAFASVSSAASTRECASYGPCRISSTAVAASSTHPPPCYK